MSRMQRTVMGSDAEADPDDDAEADADDYGRGRRGPDYTHLHEMEKRMGSAADSGDRARLLSKEVKRLRRGAVLCCAVLCCAVLCCAVLCCAVLFRCARLRAGTDSPLVPFARSRVRVVVCSGWPGVGWAEQSNCARRDGKQRSKRKRKRRPKRRRKRSCRRSGAI
jgi:hypothetical protein